MIGFISTDAVIHNHMGGTMEANSHQSMNHKHTKNHPCLHCCSACMELKKGEQTEVASEVERNAIDDWPDYEPDADSL